MKQYNLKIINEAPTDWSSIERAAVDSYVWGGAEKAYKTYGQLVYAKTGDDSAGLYIHLFCEEKNPVSKEKQLDGLVCMDSCMEFFFGMHEPGSDDISYLNLECNSIGTTFISFGVERHGRVFLDSLGVERFPVSASVGADGWDVFWFLSEVNLKKIFGLSGISENTVVMGNFYKCDENANAPFGSWSPIVAPKPDFHRPECFGEIIFTP